MFATRRESESITIANNCEAAFDSNRTSNQSLLPLITHHCRHWAQFKPINCGSANFVTGKLVKVLLILLCVSVSSFAQDPADESYIVKAWLEPAKAVQGQYMALNIMIGVDTYLTEGTDISLPEMAHALVLKQQPAVSGVKTINGRQFATQVQQVDVYSDRAGILVVPSFSVSFTQAVTTRGKLTSRTVEVETDQLLGLITLPPEMQDLGAFMVSPQVDVDDQWIVPDGKITFEAGDVLRRTVKITAQGMAAMNMPEISPQLPRGVSVTLAEPNLSSSSGRNGQQATLVQHMSYVVESPGQFTLGGETLSWWDPVSGSRRDHTFAIRPVDAGGVPWRRLMLGALVIALVLLLVLIVRVQRSKRDPEDIEIAHNLHDRDAGKRLAAIYACADYHSPAGAAPALLRARLTSSLELVERILRARYAVPVVEGEPSEHDSKLLTRQLKKIKQQ